MDIDNSLKSKLLAAEESLLQSEVRKSFQELDLLLADDFLEFGSSGRCYNKQEAIDIVLKSPPGKTQITNFEARLLTPSIALITYRLVQQNDSNEIEGCSLRTSIWRLYNGLWQVIFHQGKPCA